MHKETEGIASIYILRGNYMSQCCTVINRGRDSFAWIGVELVIVASEVELDW